MVSSTVGMSVRVACSSMREEFNSLNGPGCHQFSESVQIREEMLHGYSCL